MRRASGKSTVLTIRVGQALSRKLDRAAHRQRQTRSEAARAILERALAESGTEDPDAEARRQSLLVSGRDDERQALDFLGAVTDLSGWK